jgi:hypothetical protein
MILVDDFEVTCINKENVEHFIASLKKTYKVTDDWSGRLYCSIALEWDHVKHS